VPGDTATQALRPGGRGPSERTSETIGRDWQRKARSFGKFDGPVCLKKPIRSLGKGVPVLWRLNPAPAFNELANRGTEERRTVTGRAAWKRAVDGDPEAANLLIIGQHGHCTMIISFNKKTGEIAYSDSRREAFAERWVCAQVMRTVSMGEFCVTGL